MSFAKDLFRATILVLLTLFLSACPAGDQECADPAKCDAMANDIDPSITALAGAIDDQYGASYAHILNNKFAQIYESVSGSLFVDKAWAAACARPSSAICISESKTTNYNNCILDSTSFVYNGTVKLDYIGTVSCGFSASGDEVTRTMNIVRTLPDGGSIATTSDSVVDFRGNSIGGGTKLTMTGVNAYELNILGIHKTIHTTYNGTAYNYDLIMRTTTPISITGGLSRNSRVLNGGILEVIVARDNYVYTFSPNSLSYGVNCCYPVSGSIAFTMNTGSISGTGSITFPQCGLATVQRDGNYPLYSIPLASCE